MIKDALQYLIGLSGPNLYKFFDLDYTDNTVHPVLKPTASHIELHSLQGLADFIDGAEDLTDTRVFIQVLAPDEVNLYTVLTTGTRQREHLVQVTAMTQEFPFGSFIPSESFIIGLQANFEQTESLNQLLQIVSNVQESTIKQTQDDGVAQTVTAKVGIVKVADVVLPNPISLQPFRTFPEIEQPVSKFVLRAQDGSGGNKGPNWALFEADGCKWQLEALERIKNWLDAKVGKKIKILG